MTAFGIDMNLIKNLTEAKDVRLNYLWTAASLAQQAGAVSGISCYMLGQGMMDGSGRPRQLAQIKRRAIWGGSIWFWILPWAPSKVQRNAS